MTAQYGEGIDTEAGVVLRSEFSVVRVAVDRSANGDRLRLEDVRSGRVFWLDPLEIERLTTISHEDLTYVVTPARSEWFNGADILTTTSDDARPDA